MNSTESKGRGPPCTNCFIKQFHGDPKQKKMLDVTFTQAFPTYKQAAPGPWSIQEIHHIFWWWGHPSAPNSLWEGAKRPQKQTPNTVSEGVKGAVGSNHHIFTILFIVQSACLSCLIVKLSGWWLSPTPLNNMIRQLGLLSPIYPMTDPWCWYIC